MVNEDSVSCVWRRVPLADVVNFKSGSRNTSTADAAGEYPFFVCSSEVLSCRDFDFDEEAVIMAGNNADGVFHLHHFSGKFAARQRTYVISPKSSLLDCRWLYHQLGVLQRDFKAAAIGTTTQYVTIGMLRSAEIPIPPLIVQQRIAKALSDVEALIDGITRLITKKGNLKQAAMQQLLTGQTRLPGFHEKWDQVSLGDLFSLKNGLNKEKEFFGYGTPIVNYMDVFRCSVIRSSNLEGKVSLGRHELKNFDVKKGDVFFTRTSETTEEIGLASVMLDQPADTVFSGFLLRARPRGEHLNDAFKAYCFGSAWVRQQITSKASYTTRALTNGRILSEVLLPLPSRPEQAAIATVLSEMDAELASLEARLAKTRALKQAMMQELLTGKTRLLTPEVSHA
jgi:type I restriction enzyme S subunit